MNSKRQPSRGQGGGRYQSLEGGVQRLLQAAFRPAGASDEFRSRLIRTTLNILSERLGPGKSSASMREPGLGARPSNPLAMGTGDAFQREDSPIDRVNSLEDAQSRSASSDRPANPGNGKKRSGRR